MIFKIFLKQVTMKQCIPENKIQMGILTIRLLFLIYSNSAFSLRNKQNKKPWSIIKIRMNHININ